MQFRIKNTLFVKMYVNNVHAISKRVQFALQRYIGAVQNCGCQMAKLDIATSLLYQYYATVPVLIFFRFSVKSNISLPKIYERQAEKGEVEEILDYFNFE